MNQISPRGGRMLNKVFSEYEWKKVTCSLHGVEYKDIEVPKRWDDSTIGVVVSKFFRVVDGKREDSFKSVVTRIVTTFAQWGRSQGYFNKDKKEAVMAEKDFVIGLAKIMIEQRAAFNSPVWFNVGVVPDPQCSACFIIGVEDNMESILETVRLEGMIFKGGSGSGCNLSKIRSSYEKLSGGGYASGPVSFMQTLDANAGAIKSGGTTRRAAAMRVLNDDHPDILELRNGAPGFVTCKAEEDKKCKFLIQHGFSNDLDTGVYSYAQFQNANNSVGISDEFMKAVENDEEWSTKGPHSREVIKTYKAREVMRKICEAAWKCGDPGMQFRDTMNRWNPIHGHQIESTNPCVAYETYILTDKGHKIIGKHEGEWVNIWNGFEWSKVLIRKTGTQCKLLTVNFSNGESFDCTETHEFKIQEGFSRDGFEITKTTKELKAGDKLIKYNLPVIEGGTKSWPNPYTHGFFCADGCEATEDRFVLRLYSKDKKALLPYLSYYTGSYKEYSVDYADDGICIQVYLKDIEHKFKVPYANTSIQDRLEWFAGLADGDGSINEEGNQTLAIGSTEKDFLLRVRLMLQTLGVDSKVVPLREGGVSELPDSKREPKSYETKDCFRLLVTSNGLYQLKQLGWNPRRLKCRFDKPNRDASQFITVVSVEDHNRIDDTYCFTEPKRHLGMFNGILTGQCSEFTNIPFTSCNLASFNLVAYYDKKTGKFDYVRFLYDIDIMILAMDIIVDNATYPDPRFKKNSSLYRPLGLGYCNLGALFLLLEHAYGGEEACNVTELITALMTLQAFKRSNEIAAVLGGLPSEDNKKTLEIIHRHVEYANVFLSKGFACHISNAIDLATALQNLITTLSSVDLVRNTQVTLLAPTGTISFALGAETTGIEPLYMPVVHKILVGGGFLQIVSPSFKSYLEKKGWKRNESKDLSVDIDDFIYTLSKSEQDVVRTATGKYSLTWEAHMNVMVAAQKYLSGAISKTFNLPNSATVEDIETVYTQAWKRGLKAVAIYRDGSKGIQVLKTNAADAEGPTVLEVRGTQRKLPKTCDAERHGFRIGQSKGWFHLGYYPQEDGKKSRDIGEIWIRMDNFGSTINGLMDCFCRAVSYGLQYGVPMEKFIKAFWHMSFKPQGYTDDEDVRNAPSIPAYIIRKIAHLNFSKEKLIKMGLLQPQDSSTEDVSHKIMNGRPTGDLCSECGTELLQTGRCKFCPQCMESTGGCE